MSSANEVASFLLAGVTVEKERNTERLGKLRILRNVDLKLAPGEWLHMVGTNGCGKSTLARIIAGVSVEGASGKMQRGFAGMLPAPYVMQQPDVQLFGETPREELRFVLEWRGLSGEEIEQRINGVLERTELAPLADFTWDQLSGGQRQMAAIAAAIAAQAPLIVFDEATSMLDDSTAARALGLIRKLHEQGTAVVWVTQRLNELEPGQRVVAMRTGEVIYDGDVQGFFYGKEGLAEAGLSPCEACGLRLPYLVSLAVNARNRSGKRLQYRSAIGDGERQLRGSRHTSAEKPVLTVQNAPGLEHQPLEPPLELRPGTITVLLGANGSGKSRLMEIIAGLRPPEQLVVHYGDEPLWISGRRKPVLNETALRAYSYAGQTPEEQLFARSAEAELEFVLRPYPLAEQERAASMEAALASVGWDRSWLGRDPYQMSGGEKRRAALMSLLAPPASWLLLDEPTAGLDGAGHERLAAVLLERKREGQGILLISHETEWALPLADRVWMMEPSGRVRVSSKEQLLESPGLFARCGMQVPAWLETAHRLFQRGVPDFLIWKPEAAAVYLHAKGEEVLCSGGGPGSAPENSSGASSGRIAPGIAPPAGRRVIPKPASPISAFDPRAVWLSYILLSAGILIQKTWLGIALGAVLTLAVVVAGRIPLRPWRIPIAMLTFFTFFISVFAGLGAGTDGSWWGTDAFLYSLHSLLRPLLVMLIGLGLPLAITPLRLRRSLEQLLSVKGRVPQWGQRCILAVTLLLRFIPVLLEQWGRFSRIALARGKTARLTRRGAVRRIRDTSIPFLLSLFRMGEEVAAALESRGVGKCEYPPVKLVQRWKAADTVLLCCFTLLFALLWLWRLL